MGNDLTELLAWKGVHWWLTASKLSAYHVEARLRKPRQAALCEVFASADVQVGQVLDSAQMLQTLVRDAIAPREIEVDQAEDVADVA